jgi:hypothetical protein
MGKKIDRTVEWNVEERGNQPQFTGYCLVQGNVIFDGKLVRVNRFVYHVKGEGYRDNSDMDVRYWAKYPESI